MNAREVFNKTMHYGNPERLFIWHWDFGYFGGFGSQFWQSTVERWHTEGLSREIDSAEKINNYFKVDSHVKFNNIDRVPYSSENESEVLEETDEYIVVRTGLGKEVMRNFKGYKVELSMMQHLSHAVNDRNDWEEIKKLFRDNCENRKSSADGFADQSLKSEIPIGLYVCSLYGTLRDLVGLENISYMFYDDPDFIEEMMEFITELTLENLKQSFTGKNYKIDFADFWEDMACKSGPFISPQTFKKLMVPRYKRIVEYLKKEMKIDTIMVDSDGNVEQLIPLWLDAGFNCVYPLEVAAGMDPVKLKKEYGRDLRLIGGVDKRILATTKDSIKREVERLLPAYESGGYIPAVDHSVPYDISFDNYMYYHNLLLDECNKICKKSC